jgi:2-C-methyl-D-erythritol 4-phosphate cytidylyltransferase
MSSKYALIVAGGSGSRMGASMPKQFLMLGAKPILVHTIERFLEIPEIKIILVLPVAFFLEWDKIKKIYFPENQNITCVEGGPTRFASVQNGLNSIDNIEGLVAVHDAVRPFIKSGRITDSFEMAFEKGSAVLAVASKDSLRIIEGDKNKSLIRENVILIQTPQTFKVSVIKDAYKQTESASFTDDASVVEAAGYPIYILEGDYSNIKITTTEDLELAQILITKQK